MSLINQMLRDLQSRQTGGRPSAQPAQRRSARPRRQIPAGMLLGGGGLLGLFLLWWLAGALSGWLLPPTVSLPVAPAPQALVAEPVLTEATVAPQPSALPVSAPVASGPVPDEASAPILPEPLVPQASPSITKQIDVAPAATPPATSGAPRAERKPVAATPRPLPKPVATSAAKPPAKVVSRVHPDDLPGALLSSRRSLKAASITPFGRAEVAFRDGKRAYQANRNSVAVAELQGALDLYPGHLPARELLVDIYEMTGHSGQAMQLLAEGLEIAPDYMPLKKRYVRLLVDQGDLETAVKVLLQSGLPPIAEDPEAYVLLASLYQRLHEPFLAAQTYRNLLVVWPQTGAFWAGLGSALEAQGLPDEARKAFQQALASGNLSPELKTFARQQLARL